MIETQLEEKSTKWARTITTHLETINLNKGDLRSMKKEEVNKKVISWDDERWKGEVETKTSLKPEGIQEMETEDKRG